MKVVEKLTYPVQVGHHTTHRRFTDQVFQEWGQILKPRCQQQHEIDDNNCVPLGLMCITNTTLIQANQLCIDHLGRKPRGGVRTSNLIKHLHRLQLGQYRFKLQGVNPQYDWEWLEPQVGPLKRYTQANGRSWTLQRFVENHQTGRYLIIVKQHALALVDGVLMGHPGDQYLKPSQQVHLSFQCI